MFGLLAGWMLSYLKQRFTASANIICYYSPKSSNSFSLLKVPVLDFFEQLHVSALEKKDQGESLSNEKNVT